MDKAELKDGQIIGGRIYGDYMGYCYSPDAYPEIKTCESAVDVAAIQQKIADNCIGKSECTLDTIANMMKPKSTTNAQCWSDQSLFYLQYSCSQPETEG